MDQKQFCRMQKGNGFIAALDQSGGSTPKAHIHKIDFTEDELKKIDEICGL